MTDAERRALLLMYEWRSLFEAPTNEQIAARMATDAATCQVAIEALVKAGFATRQKASVMLTKKGIEEGRRLTDEQHT